MATYSQVGSGAVFIPRATQRALDQEVIDRFLDKQIPALPDSECVQAFCQAAGVDE